MYKLVVDGARGRETLVVTNDSEEAVYAEPQGVGSRTEDGRYPLGRCSCPDRAFVGFKKAAADTAAGANALIAAGILAAPLRAWHVGRSHLLVEYATIQEQGRSRTTKGVGRAFICSALDRGVILANGMHGVVRCCEPRLAKDIRALGPENTVLYTAPDTDRLLGNQMHSKPLERISVRTSV